MSAKDYQPVKRERHSTIKVEDYLYMWGGWQPGLPEVHDSEEKRAMCSVMEVCHFASGRWEQKPTTGTPPLGVSGYAAAAIGNEIFYYGGYYSHGGCYHNSLFSFNVDTFNWKELSPTTPHHGPWMKWHCDMVAVQLDGEDYLVVIGGNGSSYKNTPEQPGAQYRLGKCNEIHYYKLPSGEWITPTVTGDRPPPINSFTLTSVTNNTAVLFGGLTTNGQDSNNVYIINFTKTSVNCTMLSNPGGSVQWPEGRHGHSSVLINNSTGPHLLVVGGRYTSDSWLFDINKRIWKQLFNIPDTVTGRYYHSLSVWSVTPTTNWIIVFGGKRGGGTVSDTQVIELRYTSNEWSTSVIPLDRYQEKLQERRRECEASQPVQPVHHQNERREIEQLRCTLQERERELQEERREKEQVRTRLQQQLQEKDSQITDKDQRLTETQQRLQSREKEYQKREQQLQRQVEDGQQRELRLEKVKTSSEEHLQKEIKEKEQIQQERDEQVQALNKDTIHLKETKATLEAQVDQLQKELQEEKHLISRLMKQKGKEVKTDTVSEKDEEIESLKNELDEAKKKEKKLQELQEKVESLQQQLQQFIIPQSDLTDSSITVAGHGLFHLKADDRPSSFNWDKYGFRLHCPEGAVSKDTAVAVTPLLSNQFEVPKGTVLVSAVYKIEVSKPLTKRVVIELQHCVDLRNTGQTGCLKFVRAPLKSPYQFSIIDGGVFHIENRYGSIERDDFCAIGIVAEMSNGDTHSNSDSDDNEPTPSDSEEFYTPEGSVTDEDEVQQKSSDDDAVNDEAETEDQEMGSGMSHKSDDEVQLQIAASNAAFSDIIESKEKVHYSSKGGSSDGGSSDGGSSDGGSTNGGGNGEERGSEGENGEEGEGDDTNGSSESDGLTQESNNEEENTNGGTSGDDNGDTNKDTSGNVAEGISDVSSPPVASTTTQGSVNDASSEAVPAEAESTLGILNEGSSVSIESTESQEEVKEKPKTKHNVTHNDILYTGRMYYEKKEAGHWKTIYSVAKDLEVLIQYFDAQHPNAEPGDVVTVFKFVQPNGVLQLHLQTPQQLGWIVNPDDKPMKLYQSTVDKFSSNPLYSSCSMSVYAEAGVAKKPLHCPIKLTGIIPTKTVFINRPLPSSSNSTGASQTSRETEKSTFRSDVAYEVMTENIALIKSAKVDLQFLADKLLEKKIIDTSERGAVTDEHCGRTADQRMDKLLELLTAAIRLDGEDFGIFLDILKGQDNKRYTNLAERLMNVYKEKL